jgi:hypothetical protein
MRVKRALLVVAEGPVPRFHAKIVMPRHSGKILLFDFERQEVLRLYSAPVDTEYELLRRVFASHVVSVPFEVLPARRGIIEPFIQGRQLDTLEWGVQVQVATQILDRLPGISRSLSQRSSVERLASAIDASDGEFGAHALKRELLAWLGPVPIVPAHGDLTPSNIRMPESGPVCVDFDGISEQPAWFDELNLAFRLMSQGKKLGEATPREALGPAVHRFLQRVTLTAPPPGWHRLVGLAYSLVGGLWLPAGWFDRWG